MGDDVSVRLIEHLAPGPVFRVHLDGAPGTAASVIVKWSRQGPREQAALQFLADIGVAAGPRLLGCDEGAELVVL